VTNLNRPLLGEPNAPCRSCGAPLAADQRYCLQCGTRRAEARLPFLDILAAQVPQGAAAAASSNTTTTTSARGPAAWFGRMSTNAAAVAGVGCLLLALGVGVLIGNRGPDPAPAASQQVITVSGAPAAAAVPSTAAPGVTETAPGNTATTPQKSAKGKSSKQSSSSGSKATNSTVKSLDSTSGSNYSKKSAKLPKQVGTGGKAPPKDTSGAAIGGGSGVQSIG
jgi:hypothetical protein